MKVEIALTLIICGTILIAVPPASDYMHRQQVMQVMISRTEAGSIILGQEMSSDYRLGCWLAGIAMIATAVVLSVRAGRRHPGPAERPSEPAPTTYIPGPGT